MFEIRQSETFERWLLKLKDRTAMLRIQARIRRITTGNLGDWKLLREGVSEMRIDYGAGYRLYFMRKGTVVIVLLAGGDKRTQEADIASAIEISKDWKD